MAYTDPPTLSTGHVVLASEWNNYIANNMKYLHGDAGTVDISAGGNIFKATSLTATSLVTVNDVPLTRVAAGILQVDKNVFEAQAVASGTVATTFTPDCKTGMLQRYTATSGGPGTLTIAAPLSPPDVNHTALLVIRVGNASGGTATLTWNAAFVAGATLALPASIANNNNSMALFVWNSANWQIQSIS